MGEKIQLNDGSQFEADAIFEGSKPGQSWGIDFKNGKAAPELDNIQDAAEAINSGRIERYYYANPAGSFGDKVNEWIRTENAAINLKRGSPPLPHVEYLGRINSGDF